jgi:hypothetical protein
MRSGATIVLRLPVQIFMADSLERPAPPGSRCTGLSWTGVTGGASPEWHLGVRYLNHDREFQAVSELWQQIDGPREFAGRIARLSVTSGD